MLKSKQKLTMRKDQKTYWLITITCNDCHNEYQYKIPYKEKIGRCKSYCAVCEALHRKETYCKANEKDAKVEYKKQWYKETFKPTHRNEALRRLGTPDIEMDAIRRYKGGTVRLKSFKYSNSAYASGKVDNPHDEFRYAVTPKCRWCGSLCFYDYKEKARVCSKCSTVFRSWEA